MRSLKSFTLSALLLGALGSVPFFASDSANAAVEAADQTQNVCGDKEQGPSASVEASPLEMTAETLEYDSVQTPGSCFAESNWCSSCTNGARSCTRYICCLGSSCNTFTTCSACRSFC